MTGQQTLRLELAPSKMIAAVLIALHAMSLLPLWASRPPLWIAVALTCIIVGHGGWAAWRFGMLRASRSVVGLVIEDGRRCRVVHRDGNAVVGIIHSSTLVIGGLVVLAIRPIASRGGASGLVTQRSGQRLAITIVTGGMLGPEDFRRLRVMLKWGERAPLAVDSPPLAPGR